MRNIREAQNITDIPVGQKCRPECQRKMKQRCIPLRLPSPTFESARAALRKNIEPGLIICEQLPEKLILCDKNFAKSDLFSLILMLFQFL